MNDVPLHSCRILIVEDEYLLADELQVELENCGAIVIGPIAGIAEAMQTIAATANLDGAILDINLKGEMVFPVAEQLQDRRIPMLFVSGYDAIAIPPRFGSTPRCEKPIGVRHIVEALARTMQRT